MAIDSAERSEARLLAEEHFKKLENLRTNVFALVTSKGKFDAAVRRLLDLSWTKWNLARTQREVQSTLRKMNIWFYKNVRRGEKILTEKNIDFQKFLKQIQTDPNLKPLKDAIDDLSKLTITTKGKSDKTLVTEIKVLGDISSDLGDLEGKDLLEYHERMTRMSVDIIKTYSLIVVKLVEALVPWAGLKLPENFATNLQDLIKAFETPK